MVGWFLLYQEIRKVCISFRCRRNKCPWLTCSARDLIMTLAFIPVVINKCLRNINFHFTFASLHRLCVLHYCQDHIFVLKGKNLHCLSWKCFLQCLQSRLSWSYGYWNHPLELTIYNVNVNARCTVSVKTSGLILALPPNQCL